MKLSLFMGLLTFSIFQYILFRWLPLKKFITVNCAIFFFFGMLASGLFTRYFLKVEYKEDIFIAEDCDSGSMGAYIICDLVGHWKSSGEKTAAPCEIFKKYHPELNLVKITDVYRRDNDEVITYEVPAFASPSGGVHFYNEKGKYFEPGIPKLPFWCPQTFLLLPLPLLLLFNLFKYMLKRKAPLSQK